MTTYDPALVDQLAAWARKANLSAMADQLEAAQREVERLTGHLGSRSEHSRLLAKSQMVDRAAIADLTAERDALRESVHVLTAATRADQLRVELACDERDRLEKERDALRADLAVDGAAKRQPITPERLAEIEHLDCLRSVSFIAESQCVAAVPELVAEVRRQSERIAALEAGLREALDLSDVPDHHQGKPWTEAYDRLRALADTTKET